MPGPAAQERPPPQTQALPNSSRPGKNSAKSSRRAPHRQVGARSTGPRRAAAPPPRPAPGVLQPPPPGRSLHAMVNRRWPAFATISTTPTSGSPSGHLRAAHRSPILARPRHLTPRGHCRTHIHKEAPRSHGFLPGAYSGSSTAAHLRLTNRSAKRCARASRRLLRPSHGSRRFGSQVDRPIAVAPI